MSCKSSWWLRPQRKGASNRAALNEANYFMEHNKVLRERIKELAAENAKLRELVHGLDHCTTWANEDGKDCWSCPLWHEKDCTAEDIERELGIM